MITTTQHNLTFCQETTISYRFQQFIAVAKASMMKFLAILNVKPEKQKILHYRGRNHKKGTHHAEQNLAWASGPIMMPVQPDRQRVVTGAWDNWNS